MGIFLIALFCAILAVSMFYASHGRLGFWPLVFGGFGGTVIGVILSLFITIGEAPRKFIKDSCTWYTTEKNIISLKGKTEISGGFFLGTGSINSRLHYYTYVETEDGKILKKYPTNKTYVIENGANKIISHYYRCDKPLTSFMIGRKSVYESNYRKHQLFVPEGTILREFKL